MEIEEIPNELPFPLGVKQNDAPRQASPLASDLSFWAVTCTQFLGAFNDNVYKQLLLLLFVAVPQPDGSTSDMQWLALLMFALPFVLFSGFAGYLSDRFSKRRVILTCKFAEVAIMSAAVVAFVAWGKLGLSGGMTAAFCILLFAMGGHSAFFGPGKFGVLPELFRAEDLPRANGAVLMTTFLAIILGGALGGLLKEHLGTQLWIAGCVCVGIAVLGALTAIAIRPTPPTAPNLRFELSMLSIPSEIWRLMQRDPALGKALAVSTMFWLSAAIVQPAINALGKLQLHVGDKETSLLVTVVSGGIALGSIAAGLATRGARALIIQRIGAWGMVVTLGAMAIPWGPHDHLLEYRGSLCMLTALGVFTGMFAVPLQVFIQSRPPEGLKGRMVGTQNLLNWIGIFLSAGIYFVGNLILNLLALPGNGMFALTGCLMLPVALAFRPVLPKKLEVSSSC